MLSSASRFDNSYTDAHVSVVWQARVPRINVYHRGVLKIRESIHSRECIK